MSSPVRMALGALSGVAGVAGFKLLAPLERAIAGEEPPFRPQQLVGALARRTRLALSPETERLAARWLPWLYGSGWAMTYALLRPRGVRRATSVALFAAAIAAEELALLPWLLGHHLLRRRVLAALAAHIVAFTTIVDTSLEMCTRSEPRRL